MSVPPSQPPTSAPTPVPSSPPPPSESYLSDIDGTAPSILDTSFGESSYDIGRVDGGALNLVSWKLDVNARSEDGVEKRGFNAISTVLNHPTKKANPLRSSRKPLPPLSTPPPVLLKPPPPSHYDAYLQTITPLYDSFIASQSTASSGGPERVKSPLLSGFDTRTTQSGPSDLPSLDSVPSMFFDPQFNLSNPSTWSELISSPLDGGVPESGVQDTLSTHLDILERHLVHEISLRSSSFFSALSNLQDLHSESSSCLSRIGELQDSLKEIGEQQAKKGLEVITSQEELRVLKITEKGIRTIGELDELLAVTKRLVNEGDWSGGLSYIEDIVRWWEKYNTTTSEEHSKDRALPLSTLPALSNLPTILSDLTSLISIQMESALSSYLLSTLSVETPELDKASFASTAEPMLMGLVRCGKSEAVETVWRDVVTISIREGSRNHLPVGQQEEDDGDRPPEARGASLAQLLQSMDHSSFLLLSAQMYGTLLSRIKLSQQIGQEIESILKSTISLSQFTITSHLPNTASVAPISAPTVPELSDVITSGCELAHTRASKILSVRAEQHASLGLEEFVEIFRENWEFILNTEKVAGRMIVGLRGVTASQARSFLVNYHSIRLTKSARLVEEEQWNQIDVSPNVQHVVDMLVQAAVSDPSECTIPSSSPDTNGERADETIPKKQLDIEDKTYFVVKATAESLVLLGDYLKIVINLELVVTDVMSRIIEFMKSFNSRTCQVVLGAGAMRSAGLKNITAKHLALASQSLSIIISLIPYIREFVRRHLSPKQAVMLTEFDKLKRDYQEHQNEIHAKLVAIMSDRLAVHVGSLREIDWEATSSKDGPRPYAEMLVKETATLHKVLSKYLAGSTVEVVMSEVIGAIVHRLSEEYGKVEFKSEEAKKRMLQDVALISIRLTPLSESGKDVSKLETIVKEKSTPRKPIGQTMSGFLRRNGSQKGNETGTTTTGEDENQKNDDEEDDEDGAGLTETVPEQHNDEVSDVDVEKKGEAMNGETPQNENVNTMEEKVEVDEDVKHEITNSEEVKPDLPEKEIEQVVPTPVDKDNMGIPALPEKETVKYDDQETPNPPPPPDKEP
ncbi:uncharacterized protein IL334_002704 [Kwoniella shivajii]|uniref:Vacuolar protein sorting-associated protein 54 C-terminal domain-containing protein n=1 Tax=Kwoniella shivajii TaxID=564305 RepID=A0ABZ1CVG6_9TREE|nr:hypothetical protein IL334_002704 [Kwoniella shivajii]